MNRCWLTVCIINTFRYNIPGPPRGWVIWNKGVVGQNLGENNRPAWWLVLKNNVVTGDPNSPTYQKGQITILMCRCGCVTAFQMIEILVVHLCGHLIQSIMCNGAIYFATITLDYRLSDVTRCQPNLAARADEKSSSFFMPHPPHFFGKFRASQFTLAKVFPCMLPFQRNLQQRD